MIFHSETVIETAFGVIFHLGSRQEIFRHLISESKTENYRNAFIMNGFQLHVDRVEDINSNTQIVGDIRLNAKLKTGCSSFFVVVGEVKEQIVEL